LSAIKLYYESADRATLSGYPVFFLGYLNATAPLFLDNLKCCHFVVTGQFRNAKLQHLQGFLAFWGLLPLVAERLNLTHFVYKMYRVVFAVF